VALLAQESVTTDNPNVWFELGFSIAERKPIILVCSDERITSFPFDVRHRSIIKYKTESLQDYSDLSAKITTKLRATLEKAENLGAAIQASPIKAVEGLEQHEIVTLVSVAENLSTPDDRVGIFVVRQDMESAGFTKIATTLGLAALREKDMVLSEEVQNWEGETYTVIGVTPKGMQWLIHNKNLLALRKDPESQHDNESEPDEDDIPF
jgi:hypothetical protein